MTASNAAGGNFGRMELVLCTLVLLRFLALGCWQQAILRYTLVRDHYQQALEASMDEHQINVIIATAICECEKHQSDRKVDLEQAKQMAKAVVAALKDAGLQIDAVEKP